VDSQALGIALSILGGAAELVGLGLVALDVHASRQAAKRILAAPDEPPGPLRRVSASFRTAWDVEGKVPPLEERVATLERQIGSITEQVHDRIESEVEGLRGEIAREGSEAIERARARDLALRDAIADQVLSAGTGRRLLGVSSSPSESS
jgi:hypothetical protein